MPTKKDRIVEWQDWNRITNMGGYCIQATGSIVDSEGKERYRIEAIWDKWARIARVDPTNGNAAEEEHVWTANELP